MVYRILQELARDGALGIAYVVEPLARRYLREGSLKWLLPQTAIEHDGLFLYYPKRASLAPKLRAFIDVAKKISLRCKILDAIGPIAGKRPLTNLD